MRLCRIRRFLAAFWEDRPQALPAILRRHLRACPGCERDWRALAALGDALAEEAEHERTPAPPFLERRILAALPGDGNPAGLRPAAEPWRPGWAIAGAAAALTLAAVILTTAILHRRASIKLASAPASASAPALPRLADRPFLAGSNALSRISTNLDNPLELELKRVVEDASGVARYLARSVLPADRLGFLFDATPSLPPPQP